MDNICVTSYNSTGFSLGVKNFLTTLSLFSSIICLQEHFLLDSKDKKYSNTNKLRKAFSDKFDMFIVPAFKENKQVTKGRGKGGLATMWDKSLTKYVSLVKCSSFRLQATRFNFPRGSFLVLNTYFPCDPRKDNFNDEELLNLLAEMKTKMNDENCVSNLIVGDLNCHFSRKSRFTRTVENFFDELNFKIFWEHLPPNVDFTFSHNMNNRLTTSVIDHFVSNEILFATALETGVIHSGENPSSHSPIFAKFSVADIDSSREEIRSTKRVNWSKASEEAKQLYMETVTSKLSGVQIPACVECTDMHCGAHTEDIEDYTMAILEAVEKAAQECLPCTGGGKNMSRSDIVPGWTEYVKPFCDESKFWCSVWLSAGKPGQGSLYDAMMNSKRQYKYAVRRLKKANDNIQNDKFVQGILQGGVDIFTEIKKFRGKTGNCSSRIDDQIGSKNIADHFADIYSQLYSRHQHGTDFEEMVDKISNDVKPESMHDVNKITPDLVKEALKSMKNGKSDAIFDFQSDCLTQGPDVLASHLANMLRMFVSHGMVPYFILVCTLLPLVKDNLADITTSENYRAIATGSLILKLLDIVILQLEGDKLDCDELQFGFQANSSTSMCTWTATAVIEHYNMNGRVVYGCAMDLSKAFDLVEWVKLFNILQEKKVSPVFLRILLFIYRNQYCDVKWNSSYSHRFPVLNGVRQGAVSSPLLFSVYIDGLLRMLRNSGLGCYVDHFFYGCLGYADDLLIMSASRSGLQAMVEICEVFARESHLKFSTDPEPRKSKTKCLIFSKKRADRTGVAPIILNGMPLPWVSEVKHLGNVLQSENNMKVDCAAKRGRMIGKVNSLLQEFHYVEPEVMVKLLNIYVTSFYGSNLWDLYSADVDRIFKSWNVTIRNVFDVPWQTHRYLVEVISNCPHPKTLMCSRFVKFTNSLVTSKKNSVRYLGKLNKVDKRTLMGKTLVKIGKDCKLDVDALTSSLVKRKMSYFSVPSEQTWRRDILLELLDARLGKTSIEHLEKDDFTMMINHLCTT